MVPINLKLICQQLFGEGKTRNRGRASAYSSAPSLCSALVVLRKPVCRNTTTQPKDVQEKHRKGQKVTSPPPNYLALLWHSLPSDTTFSHSFELIYFKTVRSKISAHPISQSTSFDKLGNKRTSCYYNA